MYQLLESVLLIVINISPKKTVQKNFRISLEKKGCLGVMPSARNQPVCKKHDINIGCFDRTRLNPPKITQRKLSLYIYINFFCSIWKSNGFSLYQAIEELKFDF